MSRSKPKYLFIGLGTMGYSMAGHLSKLKDIDLFIFNRSKRVSKKWLSNFQGQEFIKDKFFLMLLPDDLIIRKNCSKSMIKIHRRYKSSVMASMNVNKKTVSRWGIFKLSKKLDRNNYLIKDVVEKPSVASAPSNKAVIGRYILPKKIFSKLSKQKPGKGGEIHITDAIQSLIYDNNKFVAHNFSGKYLDCGSMNGYIKSTLEIAKSWSYVW